MKQPKEGALIVGERDELSIYIRARERDAHFTPPFLAVFINIPNVVCHCNAPIYRPPDLTEGAEQHQPEVLINSSER